MQNCYLFTVGRRVPLKLGLLKMGLEDDHKLFDEFIVLPLVCHCLHHTQQLRGRLLINLEDKKTEGVGDQVILGACEPFKLEHLGSLEVEHVNLVHDELKGVLA